MAEEDTKDEGQEGVLEPSETSGGRPHRTGPTPADAAKSYLVNSGKYLGHIMHTKWMVIVFLVASLVLFLLTIVFAGVWAAAIKGYFGERLHNDAGEVGEDPERTAVVDRVDRSPTSLGIPPGPVPPPGGPCQLVLPDSLDRRFLREGFTFTRSAIGAPAGTHIEPDDAMVTTMDYLCDRHSRLAISHIISAYVNMYLDPEQQASRDPQIIRNISAHNRGQAYDLVQIDFVYKVFRVPCVGTPNWTVEYWNDLNQLLLVLPCREPLRNVNTTFAGGPATAIPIRVIWQDQPNQFALGGLPLNIDTALRTLASHLGLSPEAFRFLTGSMNGMLEQIGRTYLEELLGLPAGSLRGNNLQGMLESAFGVRLADLLGQLPRLEWGRTIADWIRSTGAGEWERLLGLYAGSLQGWGSPTELFRSVALETAANILRIPPELLRDPTQAAQILRTLSPAEIDALARDPLGARLVPIINAIRSGNTGALDGALASYGQQILELTFQAPIGSFGPCVEGEQRPCPDPYAGLSQVAARTGVDEATLRSFIDIIRDGGSFARLFETRGAPLLEHTLGLPQGVLGRILAGERVTFDAATIGIVAARLGINTAVAAELLNSIGQNQELLRAIQQIGSSILGQAMRLTDPLALFQIVTGTAPQDLINRVNQELARLAAQLNLPPELTQLQRLLTGDVNAILEVFRGLAGIQLGDIFGLPLGDIQRLISGDLSVLTNLPIFQDLMRNIFESLNLNQEQLLSILSGNQLLSQLANIGNTLNGLISTLGIDQWLIMERVYRPEARRKVHLVLRELLDMPFALNDIDLRVTQLITFSFERDVQPFEADGTLDRVYGRNRSRNFGLFAMPEAHDHLHIGY